ncbi:MAG: peptidylprolyl isomerase [Bacteroidales bacterium]|nr:peptidylprolyl isomerase [Bacteroidales bacterium]
MKIDMNTVVSLAYKIHTDSPDGALIEFADEQNPRDLIFGLGKNIPGLEKNLAGLQTGESFDFKLDESEAFGAFRQELIVHVPKSAFIVDGLLRDDLLVINNEINMMDNSGKPVKGIVREVGKEEVVMDFNHALAGKSLFVRGKVMLVRAATQEDLNPSGGCGSGCGCSSNTEENGSAESHKHQHEYEEDCPACGNPADQRGQGIGNCGCG